MCLCNVNNSVRQGAPCVIVDGLLDPTGKRRHVPPQRAQQRRQCQVNARRSRIAFLLDVGQECPPSDCALRAGQRKAGPGPHHGVPDTHRYLLP